jgi:cytochrome P450
VCGRKFDSLMEYQILTVEMQYESLRTHPTAPTLLRTTGDNSQTVTTDGKTYVLPPGYVLALNFFGLHYNPKYWGANADKFIPERWAMNSEFNRNDPSEQNFTFTDIRTWNFNNMFQRSNPLFASLGFVNQKEGRSCLGVKASVDVLVVGLRRWRWQS